MQGKGSFVERIPLKGRKVNNFGQGTWFQIECKLEPGSPDCLKHRAGLKYGGSESRRGNRVAPPISSRARVGFWVGCFGGVGVYETLNASRVLADSIDRKREHYGWSNCSLPEIFNMHAESIQGFRVGGVFN